MFIELCIKVLFANKGHGSVVLLQLWIMLMSVSGAAIEGQMDGICPCSQLMWPYEFNNALVLLSPISLCLHQDYKQKKSTLD